MTTIPSPSKFRRWVSRGISAAILLGLGYVASFAVVLSQGIVAGDKSCMYLTDVSTAEGWKSHERRAAFFGPMFRVFWQLLGTDVPCRAEPEKIYHVTL